MSNLNKNAKYFHKTNVLIIIFLVNLATAKDFVFPSTNFIEPITQDNKSSKVIIVESNFEKVRDLKDVKKLFNTSRRIASLASQFEGIGYMSYCSGSLVGPDLILTNHHCMFMGPGGPPINPTTININMEYLHKDDVKKYNARVIEVVKMDKPLDYALLRLNKPIGLHFGWLELSDITPLRGDVMIIQHPQGRSKEVSRVQSSILRNQNGLLHYIADTEGGSSGSPVFNLNGTKIIALHHVGACAESVNKANQKVCIGKSYNEGIIINRIKKEIRQYLPSCAIDGDFPGKFVNKCVYLTP